MKTCTVVIEGVDAEMSLGHRLFLTENELEQARSVVDALPEQPARFVARSEGDGDVAVPAELSRLIEKVLRIVASGGSVALGAMPDELTTTVAAEQLGMSRPTLMQKIKDGEIPAHKVGSHTRVKEADVAAFAEKRMHDSRRVFDELRALEAELGVDD